MVRARTYRVEGVGGTSQGGEALMGGDVSRSEVSSFGRAPSGEGFRGEEEGQEGGVGGCRRVRARTYRVEDVGGRSQGDEALTGGEVSRSEVSMAFV